MSCCDARKLVPCAIMEQFTKDECAISYAIGYGWAFFRKQASWSRPESLLLSCISVAQDWQLDMALLFLKYFRWSHLIVLMML